MSLGVATPATIHHRVIGVRQGQVYELDGVSFEGYAAIGDALPEPRNVKMIYVDGRLTFVTTSRRHDWLADRFGELVKEVASRLDLSWDTAGSATFRRKEAGVGVEGDLTFYFGENARIMRGGVNIDLTVQPPPDLAIEVQVSHPADDAMLVWGRIGVPEVWRFDEETWLPSFWSRREDGTYMPSNRSEFLPMLSPEDIASLLRMAEDFIASDWIKGLRAWVRDVLVPRQAGGG